MEPLAALEDLTARLDWTLDTQEETLAEAAIEDASNLARANGLGWTPQNVPPVVKTIVLGAARRFVVNNMGVTRSDAGDESLSWGNVGDKAGSVYLTTEEKRMISAIARPPSFGNLNVSAWGTVDRGQRYTAGLVPVSNGHKRFPLYDSETEPW